MFVFRGSLMFADGRPIQEVGGVMRRVTTGEAARLEGRMEVDARKIARLMFAEGEEFLLDLADGPLLRITIESARAVREGAGWVEFLGSAGLSAGLRTLAGG